MYQVPASVWNEIAATQTLETTWAQQMFPLPAEQMMEALAREEERLKAETGSSEVAATYLQIMPLLWEQTAISRFLQANPGQAPALSPIPATPSEAVTLANRDFQMSPAQRRSLLKLLRQKPT